MKKLLNTFKLASAVLFALVLSMLISTDALAASYPIGSLKYPIGTNTSNYSSSYNTYPFTYKYGNDNSNNTKKVFDLIDMYDNLNNVDKVRLAIYLLENKNFYINFNIKDIIILLKEVLNKLDSSNSKNIVNFAKSY